MAHTIKFTFLLLILSSCQNLPIEALKEKGMVEEQIQATKSLNGENGIEDYFLIVTQEKVGQKTSLERTVNNLALYTPEGNILPLREKYRNNWKVIYFEFIGEELLLIEKRFWPNFRIRITRYDRTTAEPKVVLSADIPCKYGNECEWIKYSERKLAFFTNFKLSEDLEPFSIYEYNWERNETKLIHGKLPPEIDALTGRNYQLKDVMYNEETSEFEYDPYSITH